MDLIYDFKPGSGVEDDFLKSISNVVVVLEHPPAAGVPVGRRHGAPLRGKSC